MRARLLCPPASIRRQSYLRAQSSSSGLTERARELLRSELTPRIDEILHDAGELESVEEVERMACELLLPFQSADAPPELASALVEAVGGSEAAAAPHLLTAFSVLGRGAVGSAAAASREQSRFEGLVGRLEPRAAARVIDGAAEVLQVRFERPETGEYQLGAVFLERSPQWTRKGFLVTRGLRIRAATGSSSGRPDRRGEGDSASCRRGPQ